MITTTLNKIKSFNPCASGWNTLLVSLGKTEADDDIFPLSHIMESNGFDDICWAIKTLEGEDLRKIKLYLCDIAELALSNIHQSEQTLPKKLIEVSRKHIARECTADEVIELAEEIKSKFTAPNHKNDRSARVIVRASVGSRGTSHDVEILTAVLVGVDGVSYNEQMELFLKAIN